MPEEKPDIFLPLFVGDYLADTGDLTTEEHGAYFLLMLSAWRKEARLPNDHIKLARIAIIAPERWPAIWGSISQFWEEDGFWLKQKRLAAEYERAQGQMVAASERGKAAAAARWERAAPRHA